MELVRLQTHVSNALDFVLSNAAEVLIDIDQSLIEPNDIKLQILKGTYKVECKLDANTKRINDVIGTYETISSKLDEIQVDDVPDPHSHVFKRQKYLQSIYDSKQFAVYMKYVDIVVEYILAVLKSDSLGKVYTGPRPNQNQIFETLFAIYDLNEMISTLNKFVPDVKNETSYDDEEIDIENDVCAKTENDTEDINALESSDTESSDSSDDDKDDKRVSDTKSDSQNDEVRRSSSRSAGPRIPHTESLSHTACRRQCSRQLISYPTDVPTPVVYTAAEKKFDIMAIMDRNFPHIDRLMLRDIQKVYRDETGVNRTQAQLRTLLEATGRFRVTNVHNCKYVTRLNVE